MSQGCACHETGSRCRVAVTGPLTPSQRVGEVAREVSGAVTVFERLGINHCCGAQLTLAEAAAAAGVSLPTLLAELGAAGGPSA
jgi:regulator of cell morphogenesis and NO signaling